MLSNDLPPYRAAASAVNAGPGNRSGRGDQGPQGSAPANLTDADILRLAAEIISRNWNAKEVYTVEYNLHLLADQIEAKP